MQTIIRSLQRAQITKVNPLRMFSAQARASTVAADFQRSKMANQTSWLKESVNRPQQDSGVFASALPDYSGNPTDFQLRGVVNKDLEYGEHPLDITAKAARKQADVFGSLQPNQVVLANLPQNSEYLAPISNAKKVQQFILNQVHKDLDVLHVRFVEALVSEEARSQLAYIVLTMGSKRQAQMVATSLRKTWLGDSLLKPKTMEDAKKESFNNRTVVVQGIANHLDANKVLQMFSQNGEGVYVGIELPSKNEELVKAQEQSVMHANSQQSLDLRRAQIAVQESLSVDQFYQETMENIGQRNKNAQYLLEQFQEAQDASVVDIAQENKVDSLLRIITHLQAEGSEILASKLSLEELVKHTSSVDETQTDVMTEEMWRQVVKNNEATIKKAARLVASEGQIAQADSNLERLLHGSKGEIAYAYDELLKLLDAREKLIEDRMMQTLTHFGNEERIIIEGKNFAKELEDVPDVEKLDGKFSPEHVLSLSDQIYHVMRAKNMTPQEKLQRLMMNTLNPFMTKNFNKEQVYAANSKYLHDSGIKELDIPDPRISRGMTRLLGLGGTNMTKKGQKHLDAMIDKVREDMDLPFDEIYHKEKTMIQAVIDADKALKDKQASLQDPLEGMYVDKSVLNKDLLALHSTPFELNEMKETERMMKHRLNGVEDGDQAGSYDFALSESTGLQSMLERGLISKTDYNRFKKVRDEAHIKNLGYVFLTFSHADEARQFLLRTQNAFFDGQRMTIELKGGMEHSDLDMKFSRKKLQNEAKLIDELENLRKVRAELREFEANLEDDLPQTKKLKQVKASLKNLIHTKNDVTHKHKINTRDQLEEDQFKERVKELEKKYPHVDFTTLFDTERAEGARKALHKKAFASYKAYKFLKSGVKQPAEKKLSKAKQRLMDNDPYNFPELNEVVDQVLHPDAAVPEFVDGGDRIYKPGRRHGGYSDREFLDAFFGKDNARRRGLEAYDDSIFTHQEALKIKYPKSYFMKLPEIQRKEKILKELGFDVDPENYETLEAKDKFVASQWEQYGQHTDYDDRVDFDHPEDRERSFNNDWENMIDSYLNQREKRGKANTIDLKEIGYINRKLENEYKLPIRFKDWHKLLKADELGGAKDVVERKFEDTPADSAAGGEAQEARYEEEFGDESPLTASGSEEDLEIQSDGEIVSANPEEEEIVDQQRDPFDDTTDEDVPEYAEENDYSEYQELTTEQKRINREYLNQIEKNPSLMKSSPNREEILDECDYEKTTNKDIYNHWFGTDIPIQDAPDTYGGKFFKRHEAGYQMQSDEEVAQSSTSRRLQDFYGSDQSEREDIDIYERYREQMNNKDQLSELEDEPTFQLDKDQMQPEMPRFDNYFNSLAQGNHPFDKITNDLEDQQEAIGATQEDLDFEKELYERELKGRFYGEKLTPRQFELMTGRYADGEARVGYVKDMENKQFMDKRDRIRLYEEDCEKYRRQQVLSGAWTEEESYEQLQQHLEKVQEAYVGPHTARIRVRNTIAFFETMNKLDNPERMYEKEYHFDEGLGQSLQEHTDELKEKFPGMKVETRRDRDGFAIIKTSYAPEYKYNLDEILAFNKEEADAHKMETVEEVLNAFMPAGVKKEVEAMTSEEFSKSIQEMLQPDLARNGEQLYDFDSWTKLQLKTLLQERQNGVYRNDAQGFAQELANLAKDAKFDESKPINKPSAYSFLNQNNDQTRDAIEEIFADRERIKNEIAAQVLKRVKKHEWLTKRKESDLVKPRVNEHLAAQNQKLSLSMQQFNLTNEVNEVDPSGSDFDKEAYNKLKQELKERKEAKQRIMNTGLPEFSAYMRF